MEGKPAKFSFSFADFVMWVFYGLLGFFAFRVDSNLSKLQESVATLNTQMAVSIGTAQNHEKKLQDQDLKNTDFDKRIRDLEIHSHLK